MLIVMHSRATEAQIKTVSDVIEDMGYRAEIMPGHQRTAIGLVGNDGRVGDSRIRGLPGVRQVIHVSAPYKQVSLEWQAEPTVITLSNGARIGGQDVAIMGGPCSVESETQLMEAAEAVAKAGGVVLRGGAFKPRTSPYAFQGLGEEGLKLLAKARQRFGLAVITEALDLASADLVAEYADIIQIGARNMQNFALLKEVGKVDRPVMLKRGMMASIDEWLAAAEYILARGNQQVFLCERGIRTFETATRNTLDLSAVPVVRERTHLPIIVDPAHACGTWRWITPMSRAALAAGAHGIMVEVHPKPEEALSDGPQALRPERFAQLMEAISQS